MMPKRSKLHLGPIVAIGVLTALACVAIGFVYIGGDPGATTTIIGYVAMGLGFLAAILGTLFSREPGAEARFAELSVRANTGLGAEKATTE